MAGSKAPEEYGSYITVKPTVADTIAASNVSYQESFHMPSLLEDYASDSLEKYGPDKGSISGAELMEIDFSYTQNKAYVSYDRSPPFGKKSFNYVGVLIFDPNETEKFKFLNEYNKEVKTPVSPKLKYVEVPIRRDIIGAGITNLNTRSYKLALDKIFKATNTTILLRIEKEILDLLDPDSTNYVPLPSKSFLNKSPDNRLEILNKKWDIVQKKLEPHYFLKKDNQIQKEIIVFKSAKDRLKKQIESEYQEATKANKATWNKLQSKNRITEEGEEREMTNKEKEEEIAEQLKQMARKMLNINSGIPINGVESFKVMYKNVFNDPEIKELYTRKVEYENEKMKAEEKKKKDAQHKAWQNSFYRGGKRKTRKSKNRKSKTRKH